MGTLYITVERGFGAARSDAVALLREARRLGVRLFDTADSYGAGSAEEAVRAALHPYDGLVVTTKGGYRHDRLGAWVPDARPEQLREAVEGSLGRLGRRYLSSFTSSIAPTAGCPGLPTRSGLLEDLPRQSRKDPPYRDFERRRLPNRDRPPRDHGHLGAKPIQHPPSLAARTCSTTAAETDKRILFIPWMPLGDGGIRMGRSRARATCPQARRRARQQIALAALLHRAPVMLPIPGTGSIDHLRENVACRTGISLEAEDLAALLAPTALARPNLVAPMASALLRPHAEFAFNGSSHDRRVSVLAVRIPPLAETVQSNH